MQKLNEHERKGCLLESSVREMSDQMKEGIKKCCISGCDVSFSLSIDATKVPSELEISTTYALQWVELIQITTFQQEI